LQAGDREAWEAFLQAYPDGFYANLAKVQLKKIAAEEARATAAEKARLAEQEKARLAAEGAKQTEQARAATAAKAAEQTRLAAEKAKQAEQEKAAAAEQARVAAEKAAADKREQFAALPASAARSEQQAVIDLPRAVQVELRRVGCNTGAVDGNWNAASQKALDLFDKHAGMKLDVKAASADALDAVKGKTGRICPLVCDHGFKADGDRCTKIACRTGFRINDDNECEKVIDRKPVATRDEARPKRDVDRKRLESAPAKQQSSGQIFCTQLGCRPVQKGCRLETGSHGVANDAPITTSGQREVCN
jgi:hypothetical protein